MPSTSSSSSSSSAATSSSAPNSFPVALAHLQQGLALLRSSYVPVCCFFISTREALLASKASGAAAAKFLASRLAPCVGGFRACQGPLGPKLYGPARKALSKLVSECRPEQGLNYMVVNFVGGMKEGQSYGLRKWFSTHAQGSLLATSLEACNEVLQAGGGLELEPAQLERIRALAKQCRGEIEGISLGYRQRSTAHPHLPFWGRVDTVLNAIESFDPDDDEVCLVDAPEPRRPQHVVDLEPSPQAKPRSAPPRSAPPRSAPPDPPAAELSWAEGVGDELPRGEERVGVLSRAEGVGDKLPRGEERVGVLLGPHASSPKLPRGEERVGVLLGPPASKLPPKLPPPAPFEELFPGLSPGSVRTPP
ncbi:hypothetical protein TeGR_g11815, partial [Tetraparma gracilis]